MCALLLRLVNCSYKNQEFYDGVVSCQNGDMKTKGSTDLDAVTR
jgi:hypothetical protein